MRCPNCFAWCLLFFNFCPICGTRLRELTTPGEDSEQTYNNDSYVPRSDKAFKEIQ